MLTASLQKCRCGGIVRFVNISVFKAPLALKSCIAALRAGRCANQHPDFLSLVYIFFCSSSSLVRGLVFLTNLLSGEYVAPQQILVYNAMVYNANAPIASGPSAEACVTIFPLPPSPFPLARAKVDLLMTMAVGSLAVHVPCGEM